MSRLNSSYTAAAGDGSRGTPFDSRWRTSAGTGRQTGRSRAVRKYSSISSTMRWPSWRSSFHSRSLAGSRLISADDLVVVDEWLELDEEVAVFRIVVGFLIVLSGESPDFVELFPHRNERERGA